MFINNVSNYHNTSILLGPAYFLSLFLCFNKKSNILAASSSFSQNTVPDSS